MRRHWMHMVGGWIGLRAAPRHVVFVVGIAWSALLLPAAGLAQASRPHATPPGVLVASNTDLAAATVSASAWQSAVPNQSAWVQAMYDHQGGDAWGSLAPSRPRRRGNAAAAEVEPLSLPDTDAPLLEFAARLLGRPYRFGSDSGAYDCSGFVRRVFAEFGLDLPHSSRQQFALGRSVDREALQTGDLVFFRSARGGGISHVGLYAGDGLFLHAARHAGHVRVDALDMPYYAARYAGARRLPLECSLVSAQC